MRDEGFWVLLDPSQSHQPEAGGLGTRVTRRPVEEEGLVGTLFCPSTPTPHPAVIALGGGWPQRRRSGDSRFGGLHGASARLLRGRPAAPRAGRDPPGYFARAIAWLKAQPAVGATRIAAVGNSKGSELGLLLGATYPESIKAVVGYAPSAVVWQGIPFDREVYHRGPRSPWSSRGEPVPFVELARPRPSEIAQTAAPFLGGQTIGRCVFFERALDDETAVAAASIAVEKIDGPVLVISGTDDQLWPSTRLYETVVERLKAHDHPFPCDHLRYEGAWHLITLPGYKPEASWARHHELGGSREANEFANADSWPKVLGFLEKHLKHRTE